MAPMGKINKFF